MHLHFGAGPLWAPWAHHQRLWASHGPTTNAYGLPGLLWAPWAILTIVYNIEYYYINSCKLYYVIST